MGAQDGENDDQRMKRGACRLVGDVCLFVCLCWGSVGPPGATEGVGGFGGV